MTKRISHHKKAADEAKKAALDAASVVFPDFGKAHSIVSGIDHSEKAIYHGKKAGENELNKLKNRIKGLLKRKPARKLGRKKTTRGRKH